MPGIEIISNETHPPVLDTETAYDIAFKIASEPETTFKEAFFSLAKYDVLLNGVIKTTAAYGRQQYDVKMQKMWMPRVFLLGAAIGAYAYDEAGFCPNIDDNVEKKVFDETKLGTKFGPFIFATLADSGLNIILEAVAPHATYAYETNNLPIHNQAVQDLLVRGAGMTRLYMQTALEQ